MKRIPIFTLLTFCSALLLALSLNQSTYAQGAAISNAASSTLNQFFVGSGKVMNDSSTPQVADAAKPALSMTVSQNITLNPAVVAYFPSGSYVSNRDTVLLAVVSGQNRPDVRKITVVIRYQGSLTPVVVQKSLTNGLYQFSPQGVWSSAGTTLASGNYDVDVISATEDGRYLESTHTRFYFGFIRGGNNLNGMRITEFKARWIGNGWFATLKGRGLGLRTLVMVTYFDSTVPFEVNPVVDQNGDAEAGFFLPFSFSPPILDLTQLCNITVQNLDDLRFESLTLKEYLPLRSNYDQ